MNPQVVLENLYTAQADLVAALTSGSSEEVTNVKSVEAQRALEDYLSLTPDYILMVSYNISLEAARKIIAQNPRVYESR